jgi:FkbM family methyltransferase
MGQLERLTLSVRNAERDFFFRRDSSDSRVIDQVFHANAYDLARLRRFRHLVEFLIRNCRTGKRPLIVDGGANIGASALYFATKFPDALVVAIEAEFGNYQLLAENAKGLGIVAVHGAIAAASGRVRVVDAGEGFWGYRTQSAERGEAGVRSVTMPQIYETYGSECFPFIAKIDIEGGEKDLFSRNAEWVRYTPLLIVELHDWLLPSQGSSLPFLQCVARLDRDFVYIGEDVYSIANDLDRLTPWPGGTGARTNDAAEASRRVTTEENHQVSAPSAIGGLEEPLDEEVASAMKDFQANVATLRDSEVELRAALGVLQAENDQHQRALTSSREEVATLQQALVRLQKQEEILTGQLEAATKAHADGRQELAAAREECSRLQNLETREHAIASELSLAIASLQQLREQLDERNTTLTTMTSELSKAVAARQKLESRLHKRDQQLTGLRERPLVRVAVKVGNWLNRLPGLRSTRSPSE